VSADFLGKTLSIVDVDKLKPGAKRADALLGSVDLSMFSPGPLAVAVTPDAKTALVSISAGWLGLVGTEVPAGSGTLVFVDLETLTVKGDLNIGRDPMGILISKDGKHAYVGLMSETYMAYVDIEARSFERISTGNSWNEELAVDDTGTVAILTAGTAGNAVTFTPEDGAKSLGQTLGLNADAAGTAFFPGTKLAYVVQAPTQLTGLLGGYNVIDATDPASPKVTDELRVPNDPKISYPATSVPSRMSIVYPSTDAGKLSLIEMGLEGQKAVELQKVEVGAAQQLAYGLHCDERGRVLVAVPTDHYVALVDLNTKESTIVPWEITETGPVDIKYIP
jgi:DNA-binding beta-propeller fold protein YncE